MFFNCSFQQGGWCMKIKVGEKIFLQEYEISHILGLEDFPSKLFEEILNDSCNFLEGPANGLQFAYEFKEDESREWLSRQKWIIDYNKYAQKSISDLGNTCSALKLKRNKIIDDFHDETADEQKRSYKRLNRTIDQIDHMVTSIQYMIEEKKGEAIFTFPDGHRTPAKTKSIADTLLTTASAQ